MRIENTESSQHMRANHHRSNQSYQLRLRKFRKICTQLWPLLRYNYYNNRFPFGCVCQTTSALSNMDTANLRAAALREYEIMDTPPEEAFDDLTRLTSFICGTPIALVTLLDKKRQWFKSRVGLEMRETPLEHAFCRYAIQDHRTLQVQDASLDDRFSSNPLVTGDAHIRFYAGAPLVTPSGIPIGTLCAIDQVPRELTPDQEEALAALARQVMRALELRKTVKSLSIALAEKEVAKREVATLQELLPMCAWCRKVRDDESFWHHVEHYFARHRNLQFTHGVCPECAASMNTQIAQFAAARV